MKTILYILIASFCFAQAQDLDFKFDDVIITSNDTAKVRLRSLNFHEISSLQFSIKWHPDFADLIDVVNFNHETMSVGNFNLELDDGEAIFLWYHPDGETATIADGETVFELVFLPKKNGTTPIVFDDEPIGMEASRNFEEIPFGNFSGSINIIDPAKNNVTFTTHLSKVSGESFDLPITVSGFTDISSFQFSLIFNNDMIDLYDGTSDLLDSTNVGFLDEEIMLISWFNTQGETTTLADGDTLVVLHFEANSNMNNVPLAAIVEFGLVAEVSQNFEVVNFVQSHAGLDFDITPPEVDGEFIYSSVPGLENYLTLYLYFSEPLSMAPKVSGEDSQDPFSVTVESFIAEENIYVINHTVENFGDVHFFVDAYDMAGNSVSETFTINVVQGKAGQSDLFTIRDGVELKTFETNFDKDATIYTRFIADDAIYSDMEFLSEHIEIRTSQKLNSAMILSMETAENGILMKYNPSSNIWTAVNSYADDGKIYGEVTETATFAFVKSDDLNINPETFILEQNYPNPFNPVTNIRFNLPVQGHVELVVYNMNGKRIKTLLNESQEAGVKELTWNGTNQSGIRVSSGVYFYMLKYNGNRFSKKMILMK